MSQNNDGSGTFTMIFVFFIASVLVTILTGMWLHWVGVIGAFVVVGHVADSASKKTRRPKRR